MLTFLFIALLSVVAVFAAIVVAAVWLMMLFGLVAARIAGALAVWLLRALGAR